MSELIKKDGNAYSEKELLLMIIKKLGIVVNDSHEVVVK